MLPPSPSPLFGRLGNLADSTSFCPPLLQVVVHAQRPDQVAKKEKGRWRAIDADMDRSDDQVCALGSGWAGKQTNTPAGRRGLASSGVQPVVSQRKQMHNLSSVGRMMMHRGFPACCVSDVTRSPPSLFTPPQQDITRGKNMVDSLFQGNAYGQGATHNAIMSSEDYLSQAQR